MYITTFFNFKKVFDKRKIIKDNFSYLNKLGKDINKKGLDKFIIPNVKKNIIKEINLNENLKIKDKNVNKNRFKEFIKKYKENIMNKFKNKKNKINSSIVSLYNKENNFIYCIKFALLLFVILNLIPSVKINSNILHFASNIYVTSKNNLKLASINSIYPVFNPSNYILNKNKITNAELNKENVDENNNNEKINKEINEENDENNNFIFNSNVEKQLEILDDVFNNNKEVAVFKFNNDLNVNIKKASNRDIVTFDNIKINDYSSRTDINYKELYNKVINLTKKSDKILLYNTHASESYKNSEMYKFDYSGTYRSRDEKYNMLAIAKELQEHLISKDINVVHNTTGHDYYKYTGSYLKSRESIKNEFKNKGNFGIIMDVHRDACADLDYAPKVNIKGIDMAQIMLVLGVGNNKNRNKYADDNIALAIKIYNLAEKIYPRTYETNYN